MQRVGVVALVLVALLVGVALGFVGAPYFGYVREAELDVLRDEVGVKDDLIARLSSAAAPLEAEDAGDSASLVEARERIAALELALAERDSVAVEGLTAEGAEGAEELEGEDAPLTLEDIRGRISGNAQISAQMKAMTEMAYADFLNGVELEAAAKATLRDLLVQSQIEEVALEGYAIRAGDVTGRQLQEWRDAERARLLGEAEALLSPENYEAFAEYQAQVDERMLEATLENQLRAFSSGLSAENHALATQVALEEFMIERDAVLNSDEIYTRRSPFEYQITAMDSMRQRLRPVMAEDQFRELENWLRMGDNVMRQALDEVEEGEAGEEP